jgi:D-alanyl-D-alanine carboxypeptidase (penicillin-binding protein 5/6)
LPYAYVHLSQSSVSWRTTPGRLFSVSFDVEEAIVEEEAAPPEGVDSALTESLTAAVSFDVEATLPPPTVDADYVYVANLETGQVYYAKDAEAQVVPASITKLMSALVILQEKSGALSDTVTVAAGDLDDVGNNSVMGLQLNDVITFEDLLYGSLLPSGSDATNAAGRVVGDILTASGGEARFITEMNAYAATLGMGDTNFSSTYGENDASNYSTAADLWLLLREAMDNATIATIVDTSVWTATITGANARAIFMSMINDVLEDEGVIGGKEGKWLGDVSDPNIYNAANTWVAPNGQRVGILTLHSDSDALRQADQRAIIAQLPVDFPALAVDISDNGAGGVLLENGTDALLLENATDAVLLEG